jgi:heptaprenylglyceryl phosphate synthase
MANRGIWDAVAAAGPQASIAHTDEEIAAYHTAAAAFLDRILKVGRPPTHTMGN